MYYVVDNNKIMKRGIENIDLGDPVPIKIPYGERKHVTFLLGSGFSVPCGMPTGKQFQENLQFHMMAKNTKQEVHMRVA